jgi:hypothetical protein
LKKQELAECFKLKKRDGTTVDYIANFNAKETDLDDFLHNFQIIITENYDAHKEKVFDIINGVYGCSRKKLREVDFLIKLKQKVHYILFGVYKK